MQIKNWIKIVIHISLCDVEVDPTIRHGSTLINCSAPSGGVTRAWVSGNVGGCGEWSWWGGGQQQQTLGTTCGSTDWPPHSRLSCTPSQPHSHCPVIPQPLGPCHCPSTQPKHPWCPGCPHSQVPLAGEYWYCTDTSPPNNTKGMRHQTCPACFLQYSCYVLCFLPYVISFKGI